jgi:hypothetical protein
MHKNKHLFIVLLEKGVWGIVFGFVCKAKLLTFFCYFDKLKKRFSGYTHPVFSGLFY